MKVSVLQENLAYALGIVSRATSLRSSLPILENVLVATDDGRLRLSATNLELSITCWVGAMINKPGSTTVPARTFTDLVSTMVDRIELGLTKAEFLKVSDVVSKGKVKGISADDFPPARTSEGNAIEIAAADLKDAIMQVAFATSADLCRPVLGGVLIELDGDNKLTLVALDGFRLSKRTLVLNDMPKDVKPFKVIVPARSLSELARILRGNETVSMLATKSMVTFQTPAIELVSQIIEGEYPDYQRIIPGEHKNQAVVTTRDLLTACKQADIFARNGDCATRVHILPVDSELSGRIVVSGQSAETGDNRAVVDAVVEGPAISIAFNTRFLQDALKAVKTPNVVLETTAASLPCVIRPTDDDEFLQVIMPLGLKE